MYLNACVMRRELLIHNLKIIRLVKRMVYVYALLHAFLVIEHE